MPERRAIGFTVEPMVAFDRSLPPIVGLARVGTIRAKEAAARRRSSTGPSWYDYVEPIPTCRPIVVIQDIDDRPGYGAFWGEVQSTDHKALGRAGLRDQRLVPRYRHAWAPGFQMIGGRDRAEPRACPHGRFRPPGERVRDAGVA